MKKIKKVFTASALAGAFALPGMDGEAAVPAGLGDYLPFLAAAVVLLAIGGSVYFSYKRKKDLKQLALSAGLPFDEDAAGLPYLENSGIDLFNLGHSRRSTNLIISSCAGAAKVYFFDYSYTTGSGKHRTTHNYTLAFFEFSRSIFPRFALRPENFLDKIGEMIGFEDIDIDGFPAFSKEYKLNGPDKAAVLAFFSPRTVNYFEQNPGWRIQAAGQRVIAFKKETPIPAAGYLAWMEEAKNLVSAIAA